MTQPTIGLVDLERLKRDLAAAHQEYNAALTRLDQAIAPEPDYPHPPPGPDEFQVTPMNERWDVLAASPALPGGWRGRIARFVWSLVEPIFQRQQAFNSAVVDHLNRNIAPAREVSRSIESTIGLARAEVHRLRYFQTRLMAYLQQVTPFLDTKAYYTLGEARYSNENLTAAVRGLSDEMLKHLESLTARDLRYDARIQEVRSAVAIAQQQAMVLKREVERLAASRPVEPVSADGGPAPGAAPAEDTLDSWKYVGFEDLFRGSQDDIRRRLEAYLPLFDGASDVLDVGCGRGEFLDLLRARGIPARGLDLNHEMVETGRSRGLDVVRADALGYLRERPDASLGGLLAAQVVEHLQPDYLVAFLDQAQRTLRPGSPIVLETINVACWLAFFESYNRDITHARPLHPDTLRYLVVASGFRDVEIRYSAPVADADRLQRVPVAVREDAAQTFPALTTLANTLDANVDRLNSLLFTQLDYAVVGRKA